MKLNKLLSYLGVIFLLLLAVAYFSVDSIKTHNSEHVSTTNTQKNPSYENNQHPKLQKDEKNNFFYLNAKNLKFNQDILNYYNTSPSTTKKILQNVALHLSDKYRVPLIEMEKIIYYSHVYAIKRGLDPLLVLSIIAVESSFNKKGYSNAGAKGLMQIIPRWHPEEMEKLLFPEQIWEINHNIFLGTAILKKYYEQQNENLIKTLQKYNGNLRDQHRGYSLRVLRKFNMINSITYYYVNKIT